MGKQICEPSATSQLWEKVYAPNLLCNSFRYCGTYFNPPIFWVNVLTGHFSTHLDKVFCLNAQPHRKHPVALDMLIVRALTYCFNLLWSLKMIEISHKSKLNLDFEWNWLSRIEKLLFDNLSIIWQFGSSTICRTPKLSDNRQSSGVRQFVDYLGNCFCWEFDNLSII